MPLSKSTMFGSIKSRVTEGQKAFGFLEDIGYYFNFCSYRKNFFETFTLMIDKNLHNLNLFTKLLFYRLNCNKNTETKDPKLAKINKQE